MQLLKKVPETVWLFVLCCAWRYLPLQSIFTFDTREEWLAVTIILQSIFCAAVFCAGESRWRAAIIGIEIINIFYSVGVAAHWDLRDNLFDCRPIFIQLSFILQLLFISIIAGGGDGNQHRQYNRRKSDRAWDIDHHNAVIQRLFIHQGHMEAQK
jgi:hypothetical protein